MPSNVGQRFPATIWTTLKKAAGGSRSQLNLLIAAYRPAVMKYLRAQEIEQADADDIAQEVFREMVESRLLERVDRAKGRFRCLIIALVKHVRAGEWEKAHAQKRGGEEKVLSLDGDKELKLEEIVGSRERDEQFDRHWVQHMIKMGLQAVRERSVRIRKPYYQILKLLWEKSGSNKEVCQKMGLTQFQATNLIHQARKVLVEEVRRLIEQYSSSAAEYQDEVRYLLGFLKGDRGAQR
jgi:RNA polymerase sigma-70 factor (ECF subfamily)